MDLNVVDFLAGERHFVDHLAPIWNAIPISSRGLFLVSSEDAGRRAAELGVKTDPFVKTKTGPVVVVASIGDYKRARPRRVILAEHGSGQTYSNRHSSYAGGIGREDAIMFMVPNRPAAERNKKRNPKIPTVIIGCPRLENADRTPPAGRPTAAISFHWRCKVAPEADTAFDHYAHSLADVAEDLDARGVHLIGHGHPRIIDEVSKAYTAAGIEIVESFDDVIDRAHVYAVDNSSTLFEFAYLGRPVVVMNAPHYRRHIEHGLRFWSASGVGVNVEGPEGLADGILEAFADSDDVRRSRETIIRSVYPVADGISRAVESIMKCLVCGSPTSSCGSSDDEHTPTDLHISRSVYETRGAEVKNQKNRYVVGGTVLKLSDAHAASMGLTDRDLVDDRVSPPAKAAELPPDRTDRPEPADDDDSAPRHKKRPQPTTTRRRRPAHEDVSP